MCPGRCSCQCVYRKPVRRRASWRTLGILVSFVLGYFILKMNAPMNACGVAINLAATGGTVFILAMVCGSKNNSTSIVSASFPNINIPDFKGYSGSGTDLIRSELCNVFKLDLRGTDGPDAVWHQTWREHPCSW